MPPIFTVGHSNHPLPHFLQLLQQHQITALGDIRSTPAGRFSPQFDRESLREALRAHGIRYVYLGDELGGRPSNPYCWIYGRVSYQRMASTEMFRHGLNRVRTGTRSLRIALMCSEKDPVECHRGLLIGRCLSAANTDVRHILASGEIESQADMLARLKRILNLSAPSLFDAADALADRAYLLQEERIAYRRHHAEVESLLENQRQR
jgi:uncharacterized protein (DUF488 family)